MRVIVKVSKQKYIGRYSTTHYESLEHTNCMKNISFSSSLLYTLFLKNKWENFFHFRIYCCHLVFNICDEFLMCSSWEKILCYLLWLDMTWLNWLNVTHCDSMWLDVTWCDSMWLNWLNVTWLNSMQYDFECLVLTNLSKMDRL